MELGDWQNAAESDLVGRIISVEPKMSLWRGFAFIFPWIDSDAKHLGLSAFRQAIQVVTGSSMKVDYLRTSSTVLSWSGCCQDSVLVGSWKR